MLEEERKSIVSKIQKEIEEKEGLSSKYDELKRLEQDPMIIEYLRLLKDIKRIEEDINPYKSPITGTIDDSLEKRISFRFRCARHSCSCNHEVLIYEGSYYKWVNFENETDYLREESEDLKNPRQEFAYNRYVCLECGKKFEVPKSDLESFESSHLILRTTGYMGAKIEYYQNLYYQMLYNNCDFSYAREVVIDEFNNEKVKTLSFKK